jgi:hypothetical protein
MSGSFPHRWVEILDWHKGARVHRHKGKMARRNKSFSYGFMAALAFFMLVTDMDGQNERAFTVKGYVNTLQSVTFDSLDGTFINDNIIHNRLNFRWYATGNLTFAAEMRNRLFTGDMVRMGAVFADQAGADQGLLDMSWNVASEQSFLINTTIDRLWMDYHTNKFQATIGRQRINWGQTFVWNPNDLFNVYSYFDVDYEERPGSDALRLQYYTSYSSAMELVVKADSAREITAAGLYRFNKWGYDFQFLAGYYDAKDLVIGTGWSGSVGSLSFRGEASLFLPVEDVTDRNGVLIATAGLEKTFSDNSFAQLQLMYCNSPVDVSNFTSFYFGDLSAKTLAFSEFTAFGQFTRAVTPILNIGLAAMWMPDLQGYFAGPSVSWSIAENLDFSFFWQYFSSDITGDRQDINLGFLRIKYSF